MFAKTYIPQPPFAGFKWKWASLQCTEGLNDPVVLLGVLFRMRKLEGKGLTYRSPEFAHELVSLSKDIEDSVIGVDLARRTGERNLIRNSGQYWRALGLIPTGDRSGLIQLTDFGRKVADREISQSEFAAISIQKFRLPNEMVQSSEECELWQRHKIEIYPLLLLLQIMQKLNSRQQGYLSADELLKIIIPLSSCHAQVEDYINFILWHRNGEINLADWPNCCISANDHRIAKEFLLFLVNYGYVLRTEDLYVYNSILDEEITEIIAGSVRSESFQQALMTIRSSDVISDIERKRVESSKNRPNQSRFRKDVLATFDRCIITNVAMPEVLEAAHIKPYKYKGEDTVANGFTMRMDIHLLFDIGHLRIAEDGTVHLSNRARVEYGATIPPRIYMPAITNLVFVRWRWENYNGM